MKLIIILLLMISLFSCSTKKINNKEISSEVSAIKIEEQVEDDIVIIYDQEDTEKNISTNELYSDVQDYQVQKHDTLMIIAFKIYGDCNKWREIAKINPRLEKNAYALSVGETIKFKVPTEAFSWMPRGVPYLIKTGDTLGTISSDVYDTAKRWPELYKNNKPIISNPNLIFAGFTLFYVPDEDTSNRLPAQL